MGLSVKWAAYNVGATCPEEYGDYYAWGETETKSVYSWATYFDNPSGDGESFSKYYRDGGKVILEPEDDVAHVKWGGNWRIPTADELNELFNSCIWEWTEYHGTKGCLVYGIDSGNMIFIPEAGSYYGSHNNDTNNHILIWSSCLFESDDYYAYYGGTYRPYENSGIGGDFRDSGNTVRPVCDQQANIQYRGTHKSNMSLVHFFCVLGRGCVGIILPFS